MNASHVPGDSRSDYPPKDVPTPKDVDAATFNNSKPDHTFKSSHPSHPSFAPHTSRERALYEQEMALREMAKSEGPGEDVQVGWGKAPSKRQEPPQPMRKSRVIAHQGAVLYVDNGTDARAAEMLEKGHRMGSESPSFFPQATQLTQGVLCKSCNQSHPAMLTACPSCGVGTTLHKSFAGAGAGKQGFYGAPQALGGGLMPTPVQDVYAPTLSLRDEE